MGDTQETISSFPKHVRQQIGWGLDNVQHGRDPPDWKPMKSVGSGVREIRTRDADGQYRVIYVVVSRHGVYVLHAFQKKTQKTPKRDIDLARARLKEIEP